MDQDQYMLPYEFYAIVAFLFTPAFLLALIAQTAVFSARRMFRYSTLLPVVLGYGGMVLGGLAVAAAVHKFAPSSLGQYLGVRDISLGGQLWPVMPLAFISVAMSFIMATGWVLRYAGKER